MGGVRYDMVGSRAESTRVGVVAKASCPIWQFSLHLQFARVLIGLRFAVPNKDGLKSHELK